MKSMYDTSTCVNCNERIDKGVEIEKNADGKWVHSVCPKFVGELKEKIDSLPPEKLKLEPAPEEDRHKDCILGCVRAAEFFKSIDYPKELWNLSTIWNTERIKKK